MTDGPPKVRKHKRNAGPSQVAEVKTSVDRKAVNANWLMLQSTLTEKEKNPPPQPSNGGSNKIAKARKKRLRKRHFNSDDNVESIANVDVKNNVVKDAQPNKAEVERRKPTLTEKKKNPPPQPSNGDSNKITKARKKRLRKRHFNLVDNVESIANVDFKNNVEDVQPNKAEVERRKPTLTKVVAMDCEMVGIGEDGKDNMLARVSLVNSYGDCLYDKFVKPREPVTDYRTSVSGVRRPDLVNGEPFVTVQQEVSDLLKGRFLVGHAIKYDLAVLFLSHPNRCIRDTSKYKPFRKLKNGGTPSLKKLAMELLDVQIQKGEHSSVEDARAAMQLYCLHSKQWETTMAAKDRKHRPVKIMTSAPKSNTQVVYYCEN